MTNQLSPAAQAVDNAIADVDAEIEFTDLAAGFNAYRKAVAAVALRAAADRDETLFDVQDELVPAVRAVRTDRLLAIAAELEGAQ